MERQARVIHFRVENITLLEAMDLMDLVLLACDANGFTVNGHISPAGDDDEDEGEEDGE